MTRKIKWNKKDLNTGQDSSGVGNIEGINGTENGIKQGYRHGSLTKGLVAYYPIERGKGQIIRDAAHNNTGQIKGAMWSEESEVGDYSLEFDGDNDYVSTTFSGDFFAEGKLSSTVSVWVKSGDSDGDSFVLAGTKEGELEMNSMQVSWGDDYNGTIGRPTFILDDNNNDDNVVEIEQNIDDNEWHHIVFVVNGSDAGDIRGYIDGSLADIHIERDELDEDELVPTSAGMKIGARDDGDGGVSRHFEGQIEEVRIYNRVLSSQEIQALYNLSRPNGVQITEGDVPGQEDGGVSRWKFDDDLDTDTATDSWSDNDGVIEGAVYTSQRVYGSNAMSFGDGDYIEAPHSDGLDLTQAWTVSLWVFTVNDSDHQRLVTKGEHNVNDSFDFYISSGEELAFRVNNGDDAISSDSRPEIPINDWFHAVITRDENGKTVLYLDGVIKASEEIDQPNSNNEPLVLGNLEGLERALNGRIDDVRVYDRALSPVEVEKLFKKGAYRINRGDTVQ